MRFTVKRNGESFTAIKKVRPQFNDALTAVIGYQIESKLAIKRLTPYIGQELELVGKRWFDTFHGTYQGNGLIGKSGK